MKKLTKILVLVLSVALLVGVLALVASAADETPVWTEDKVIKVYNTQAAYLADKADGVYDGFAGEYNTLKAAFAHGNNTYILLSGDWEEGAEAVNAGSYVLNNKTVVLDLNGYTLSLSYNQKKDNAEADVADISSQRITLQDNANLTVIGNGGAIATSSNLIQLPAHNATVTIDGGEGGITITAIDGYVYNVADKTATATDNVFIGSEGIIKGWASRYIGGGNTVNLYGNITYVRENSACDAFVAMYSAQNGFTVNIGKANSDRTVRDSAVISMVERSGSYGARFIRHLDHGKVESVEDVDTDVLQIYALVSTVNVNNATFIAPDGIFSYLRRASSGYDLDGSTDDDLLTYNINNSTFDCDSNTSGTAQSLFTVACYAPYRVNINSSEIYDDTSVIYGQHVQSVSATTNNVLSVFLIDDSYISVVTNSGSLSTFAQRAGTLVVTNSLLNVNAFCNLEIFWIDYDESKTSVKWPSYAEELGGYGVYLKDGNAVTNTSNKGDVEKARTQAGIYTGQGWGSNKLGSKTTTTSVGSTKTFTKWGVEAYLINDSGTETIIVSPQTFTGTAGEELYDCTNTGQSAKFTGLSFNFYLANSDGTSRRGKFTLAANEYFDAAKSNTYVEYSYYDSTEGKTYNSSDPHISLSNVNNSYSATTAATYKLANYAYHTVDFDLMTPEAKFVKETTVEYRVYDYSAGGSVVTSTVRAVLSADGTWTVAGKTYKMSYVPGVWQHITLILEIARNANGEVDFGTGLQNNSKLHLAIDGEIVHTFDYNIFNGSNISKAVKSDYVGMREVRIYFDDGKGRTSDEGRIAIDNILYGRYSIDTTNSAADIADVGVRRYDFNLSGTLECPADYTYATLGDAVITYEQLRDEAGFNEFLVDYVNSLTPASLSIYGDYDGTLDVSGLGNFTFFSYKTNGYEIALSKDLPTYYDEATDMLTVYGPGVFAYGYASKDAYLADKADGTLSDAIIPIAAISDIEYASAKLGVKYVVFVSDYVEGTDALDTVDRNGDGSIDSKYEKNDTVALTSDVIIDLNGYDLTLEYFQSIAEGSTAASTFTHQRLQVNKANVTIIGNGGGIYSAAAIIQYNGDDGNVTFDGGDGGITLSVIDGKCYDYNNGETTQLSNLAGGNEGFVKFGTNDKTGVGTNNVLNLLGVVNVDWTVNSAFQAFIVMYPQAYSEKDNKVGNVLNIGKSVADDNNRSTATVNINYGFSSRKNFIAHRDDYGDLLTSYTLRSTVNINNATLNNPDMYFFGAYNNNMTKFDDDYIVYRANNSTLDFSKSKTTTKTLSAGYGFPVDAVFNGCVIYDDANFLNTSIADVIPQCSYRFNECYISVRADGAPTTFSQGVLTCVMDGCYLDIGYASNCGMYWLDYDGGNGTLVDGTTPNWPWYAEAVGGYGFYVKDGCVFSNTAAGKGNNSTASKKPGGYTVSGNNGGAGGNKLGSLGVTDISTAYNYAYVEKWDVFGYAVANRGDLLHVTGTNVGQFDGTVGETLLDLTTTNIKTFLGQVFAVGTTNNLARKGKFTAAQNPIAADGNTYVVHGYYAAPDKTYSDAAPYFYVETNSRISDSTNASYKMSDFGMYTIDFDLMTAADTFTDDFNPQFFFRSIGASATFATGVGIFMDKNGVWTDKSGEYAMPYTPGVWQHITVVLEMPVADGAVNFDGLDTAMKIHLYVDGVKAMTFDDLSVDAKLGDSQYYLDDYSKSALAEIRINYSFEAYAADNSQLALDNFAFARYPIALNKTLDEAASHISTKYDLLNVAQPEDLPFATYDDVVIDAENAEAGLIEYLKAYLNGTTNSALNLYTDFVGEVDFAAVAETIGKQFSELKYIGNGFEIPVDINYVANTENGVTVITERATFTVSWYGKDGTALKTETVFAGESVEAPDLSGAVTSNGWYKIQEAWADADGNILDGESLVVVADASYYCVDTYVSGLEKLQYTLKLMGHSELVLYLPTENVPAEIKSNTVYSINSKGVRTAVSADAVVYAGANYFCYDGAFYSGALSIASPIKVEVDTVVATPDGDVTLTSKFEISPLLYINYILQYADYYADELPVIANMLQYTMELYKATGNTDITKAAFYDAYVASADYRTALEGDKAPSFSEAVAGSINTGALSKYATAIKFIAGSYESGFALDFKEPQKDSEGKYVGEYVKDVHFVIDGWLDRPTAESTAFGYNSGVMTYSKRRDLYTKYYDADKTVLKSAQSGNVSIHNIIDEKITIVLTVVDSDGATKQVSGTYNMDAYYYAIAGTDPTFANFLLAYKAYAESATYYRYGNYHHYPDYDREITVSYASYGAKGDGVADDVAAIRSAHEYANSLADRGYTNVTVAAEAGATYRLGDQGAKSIVVRTSTDWSDANFILDDKTVAGGSKGMSTALFSINSDYSIKTVKDLSISLTTESKNIGYAPGYEALVVVYNDARRNYVRHGSNQDNGYIQQDVILVDGEGNISDTTPLLFDIEVTRMEIVRTDDAPITVKGGSFTTLYNEGHSYVDYNAYNRGILIKRSNVTLDGAEHDIDESTYLTVDGSYMISSFINSQYTELTKNGDGDSATFTARWCTSLINSANGRKEDNLDWQTATFTYKSDKSTSTENHYWNEDLNYYIVEYVGNTDYIMCGKLDTFDILGYVVSRSEDSSSLKEAGVLTKGAPMGYFVRAEYSNNVNIKNCVFECPKTFYYFGTGNRMVNMGSYANTAGWCNEITWENCVQRDFRNAETGEVKQQGQMGSNYCKNMYYINNQLSRLDAHKGAGNITVIGCDITRVNLIGGGNVLIKDTTFHSCESNYVFNLRSDYGGLWMGDVVLENVTIDYSRASSAALFTLDHNEWEFGYGKESKNSSGSAVSFETSLLPEEYDGYDGAMPTNVIIDGLTLICSEDTALQLATGNVDSLDYNITTATVNPYKVTENFIIKGKVEGIIGSIDADGNIVRSGSFVVDDFVAYENISSTNGSFNGVNIDTSGIVR